MGKQRCSQIPNGYKKTLQRRRRVGEYIRQLAADARYTMLGAEQAETQAAKDLQAMLGSGGVVDSDGQHATVSTRRGPKRVTTFTLLADWIGKRNGAARSGKANASADADEADDE